MSRTRTITLAWAQLSVEHLDRAAALAERLGSAAQVCAIGMAGSTRTYADTPPATCEVGARTVTLFPGQCYEDVPAWRRGLALLRQTWRSDMICMGIGYDKLEALLVSWLLRLGGKRVVMLNDTKFEDRPRTPLGEIAKRLALSCYSAAIVAGARNLEYFRFLGFRRRPVLPGCDTIALDRIRANAAEAQAPAAAAYAQRHFVFVGRFVDVKNLTLLIEGYAAYAGQAGAAARRLVVAGSGPLEADLRARIDQHGIAHLVELRGFLTGAKLARCMADAAALVLSSYSETWGLVVNEAMALGIPAVISEACGARDTLVRNLINGVVFESGSAQALAAALAHVGGDERRWMDMVAETHRRAWLADTATFADAVELLLDPQAQPAGQHIARYRRETESWLGRSPF